MAFVNVELNEKVLEIELNRPRQLNALNLALLSELTEEAKFEGN